MNSQFVAVRRFVLCALLYGALSIGGTSAQETTGGIRGAVTDASDALVPGATVEASSPALVRPVAVVTDNAGAYLFLALPAGTYRLIVTLPGFKTFIREDIKILVGQTLRADITLEVGTVETTVTVSGRSPMVDVSQSKVAVNVEKDFFDRIPKGRSFSSLIILAPGARGEGKAGGYQIDGSSGAENVFVVDGVEVTDLQHGTLPPQANIPVEFIQEVQIKSSGFEAQYGGATGGVVNAIVRSGSNDFHGQASLFYNSDSLEAGPRPSLRINPLDDSIADYFQNVQDEYRLLNPGASLGGPVITNKLWFFSSWFPEFSTTYRPVTFLVTNSSAEFVSKSRRDFLTTKLDFAPWQKLRTNFTYLYSPVKVNGYLPSRQGTSSPLTPWAELGYRSPGASYSFGADYTSTNKLTLSIRGGYNYRNYKDYGIPRGTYYRFVNSNLGLGGVPSQLQRSAGNVTTNNFQTLFDSHTRFNVNADVSWIFNLGGQHILRGGYHTNRLHNEVNAGWPDAYILLYWNRSRAGITVPGSFRGQYGYYINRVFGTLGDVSSDNTGVYLQDSWQIAKNLTLNIGLRTEREFVPSFRTDGGIPSRAIDFGFADKLAPRLGFSWDVRGNQKLKLYGSWGLFYDLMKYELPRLGFGGDQWKDYVYTLEDPDYTKINLRNNPGKLIEVVDWRIPSNDPSDNTIDPNLKPMRSRNLDFGSELALTEDIALSLRYTRKRLDRAIEDVGILTPLGEKYFIANPGYGLTARPGTFEPGVPVTPRARRNYDGIEIRADRRFSRDYTFAASYTYGRLYGNYGGLASSDEGGRESPNVNRYFDLPFMSYDSKGRVVEGLLPTDRPHTIRFFGSYILKTRLGETNFAPSFYVFSGSPLSTEVDVFGVPVFVNGRGDMSRTPALSSTSALVYHEHRLRTPTERYRVRFELTVFNLFNQSTVTNRSQGFNHPNDGGLQFADHADFFKGFDYRALMESQGLRVNPAYGLGSSFLGPRSIRLGIHFFF